MTHQPIQPEFHARMNDLAQFVDGVFNGDLRGADRKVGFVLLAFPFGGDTGRMNYISNAERADIITALKELVANFEGRVQTTEVRQ